VEKFQPIISLDNNKRKVVFDPIRKRRVVFTPEELVRQYAIFVLTTQKGIPPSQIAIEKTIKTAGLTKRVDIAVYGKSLKLLLIIECKKPDISLDQSVLDQVLRYNLSMKAPFVALTNATEILCCRVNEAGEPIAFFNDFPDYTQLNS
jgi:type I site-specific restriction endonuclease